jgi:hypothetical protein
MFNLLKRDPSQDKLKIPQELLSATLASAVNACNVLKLAGLSGKFSRKDMFAEVCGAHIKTVIATMSRREGLAGLPFMQERFNKGALFLYENLPDLLNRLNEPKISKVCASQGIAVTDLAMMQQLLMAESTYRLASSYYMGEGLNVSDGDVLNFARKYNPKLLTLSSEDRSNTLFAYIVRCVKLSHLEDISNKEFRTLHVIRLNDTLVQAAVELEAKVDKLLPKG